MNRARLAALAGAACLLATTTPSNATTTGPHWLTPELAAAADAAGPAGVPLPPAALAQLAVSTFAFTGIRPGTLVRSDGRIQDDGFCTANFVFQETTGPFDPAQQLYLGTAAHCVDMGDSVTAVAAAPGPGTPVLVRIGQVILADAASDFALVELDPAVNPWVSPSMAHWGGPVGVHPGGPAVATFVGHGGFVGGTVPRAGELTTFTSTGFVVRTVSLTGDSGGPVTTLDGNAVGGILGGDSVRPALGIPVSVAMEGPSIALMLSLSGKALSTCPTRTPWPLPGCAPV